MLSGTTTGNEVRGRPTDLVIGRTIVSFAQAPSEGLDVDAKSMLVVVGGVLNHDRDDERDDGEGDPRWTTDGLDRIGLDSLGSANGVGRTEGSKNVWALRHVVGSTSGRASSRKNGSRPTLFIRHLGWGTSSGAR